LELAHQAKIAEGLEAKGLLGTRYQYFPKGTDFNQLTDEQITFVMDRLNNRPRKTPNGRSPNELLLESTLNLAV